MQCLGVAHGLHFNNNRKSTNKATCMDFKALLGRHLGLEATWVEAETWEGAETWVETWVEVATWAGLVEVLHSRTCRTDLVPIIISWHSKVLGSALAQIECIRMSIPCQVFVKVSTHRGEDGDTAPPKEGACETSGTKG